MGLLIEGKWHDRWYETKKGRFVRDQTVFRDRIAAAEPNRYHLYVSYACPWASRTLIFRKLKKLEDVIGLSVVHPLMLEHGWTFEDCDGCTGDTVNGKKYLYEIYLLAKPDYTGRVTVPVLWDKKERTIVNNSSPEIIRILNSEFNALSGESELDFYPEALRPEIDEMNELVYPNVNDGVYRCGFATTQAAYEEAFDNLFNTLDQLEARLARQRYLCGDRITEADWRLFTTLVRFDPVYHGHFKCNLRRLVDYPNLWGYTRDLYQVPGVAETVHLDHIKQHYYGSHKHINPTGIVPKGPDIDYAMPHDRAQAWT
ncbi:MAG TPA: glutathione S-transferase family protein [Polyangiaceae bacterium]|jgi:putative glutathione S-transferase|nr:glutathione S-transferase family protein [Polyangiaceae bacterium]